MKGNQYAVEALQALLAFTNPLPHTINFYRQQELPFGIFSNFFPAKIIVNGVLFPTSEHYFQAMKFAPTSAQGFNDVVNCATPGDAAAVGRDRGRPLRPDWEAVKDDIMFDAIAAKFLQHDELFQILMKTRGCKLVEQARNDYYWGVGADGSGKNMLGILLMKLRDSIENVAEVVCAKDANAFKMERSKINGKLRETGVNGLRSNSGGDGDGAFGFGVAASVNNNNITATQGAASAVATSNVANQANGDSNDDDDDDEVEAQQQQEGKTENKKKKNRLQ